MKKTIEDIILKINKGHFFDTHSIIEFLIQNHSDIYLLNYENGWTTDYYHSVISKKIASFEGELVSDQGNCWSMNIHKNFTSNKCWLKL